MAKATHKGTCQVCHRLQMLPRGVMAKHGYSVEQGFFNGVCYGAGHLPLEQSCELVKKDIVRCKQHVESLASMKTQLQQSTESNAWINVYEPSNYFRRSGYVWKWLPIVIGTVTYPGGSHEQLQAIDGDKRLKIDGHEVDYTKEIAKAVKLLNQKYIERVIDQDSKQVSAHIAMQEKIVANWKPSDLKQR